MYVLEKENCTVAAIPCDVLYSGMLKLSLDIEFPWIVTIYIKIFKKLFLSAFKANYWVFVLNILWKLLSKCNTWYICNIS